MEQRWKTGIKEEDCDSFNETCLYLLYTRFDRLIVLYLTFFIRISENLTFKLYTIGTGKINHHDSGICKFVVE